MFDATICADDGAAMTARDRAVLADPGHWSSLLIGWPWLECGAWDVDPVPGGHLSPAHGDVPALIISGSLDPIAPTSFARSIAKGLSKSTLVVYPAGGHGVMFMNDCATGIANAFYADPTATLDTSCVSSMPPPSLRRASVDHGRALISQSATSPACNAATPSGVIRDTSSRSTARDAGPDHLRRLAAPLGEDDRHAPPVVLVHRPVEVAAHHERVDELARRLLGDAEVLHEVAGGDAVVRHAPEHERPVAGQVLETRRDQPGPDRSVERAASGAEQRGEDDGVGIVCVGGHGSTIWTSCLTVKRH